MKRSRVLLTFLGGCRLLDPTTGKPKQYHRCHYRFEDGWEAKDTEFFGLEVVRWMAQTGTPLDQVILAGTSTSMWDLFAQKASDEHFDLDDLALKLIERCEPPHDGSLSPGAEGGHLEALGQSLSRNRWRGVGSWRCMDLPLGTDQKQHMELLSLLAAQVPPDSELWIDITHGFRIFPMFALALGQILSVVKNVRVGGILYGAYDMRDDSGIAPVIDLQGLLQLQKWTDALAIYKASGSLSPFVTLLKEDGATLNGQIDKLREITLAERANSLHRVRDSRKHVSEGIKKDPPRTGTVSHLFAKDLEKAVSPYPPRLSQAQRERARHFWDHDELFQATILCHEGLVSRAVEESGHDAWVSGYEKRESVHIEVPISQKEKIDILSKVRNSLAHGTPSDSNLESSSYWRRVKSEAEDLRRNPDKLAGFLREILNRGELWG
ncbi:MAG TPA: TIGR02221 family CRISPR-associated protein [Fibrobacteria bacterium]|nr:TIGR02221 family CRISPR-associated protein [Fibrobacteria bacterium]